MGVACSALHLLSPTRLNGYFHRGASSHLVDACPLSKVRRPVYKGVVVHRGSYLADSVPLIVGCMPFGACAQAHCCTQA